RRKSQAIDIAKVLRATVRRNQMGMLEPKHDGHVASECGLERPMPLGIVPAPLRTLHLCPRPAHRACARSTADGANQLRLGAIGRTRRTSMPFRPTWPDRCPGM